jgi:hypothetical protein
MKRINLDACGEAIKQFVLSLSPGPGGAVLELDGRPVAQVLPVPEVEPMGEWDTAKDARRCELIDREIAGTLNPDEAAELRALQSVMLRHRQKVAPLPLKEARQLHQELLAKAAGHGAA